MQYDRYRFSKKEWILYAMEYIVSEAGVAFLFYDSPWAFLLGLPGFFIFIKLKCKQLIRRRTDELKVQFQDAIVSMSTALVAGYSVENAIRESYKDMVKMYDNTSMMTKELNEMIKKMELGMRPEELFSDFAFRTHIEEINDFSLIFTVAGKSGAAFSNIIANCVNILQTGRDTEREIKVLLSGKQYEQKVMCTIPFLLITYLRLSSPEFIGVLYHNPLGIAIMTASLLVYAGAIFLSFKISDIRC